MQKLRLDFYESGVGETIIITFPSGGIGIIDAHPSKHSHRDDILKLVAGKKIHFVCLSHPHTDHGRDLVQVLENHPNIDSFWHTLFDVPVFIYSITQNVNFPSAVRQYATKLNQDTAEFFLDILGAVEKKGIPTHALRSDLKEVVIDGVEIHCLSPEESVQNSFSKAYREKLDNLKIKLPNLNLLSAIFVLKFGDGIVLLGSDALRENWEPALRHYHKRQFPKTKILKVPHHGAKNAIDLRKNAKTYLDVCSQQPKAKAIIFAGDAKHPDDAVFQKIKTRADTLCLANGRKKPAATNPLNLQLPGASFVYPAPVCNPVLSFELESNGNVTLVAGVDCSAACV